jgi:hypothetical protein
MDRSSLIRFLVEFEIRSSWWAGWLPTDLAQRLTAIYFVRKVERKVRRYERSVEFQKRLEDLGREVS